MIQKSAILPIVMVVLLVLNNVFHISFPDGTDEQISNGIVDVAGLYIVIRHGILKNHKI